MHLLATVTIAAAASLAAPAGAAAASPLRDCDSHAEGTGPQTTLSRPGDVVVGPFAFSGLQGVAGPDGLADSRSRRVYLVKAGALVAAGTRATLAIGRSARGWVSLSYATRRLRRVSDGHPAVRFQACAADHPAFSYPGPVGVATGFAGGFILSRPGCVPLEVRVPGRATVRARVPFGVASC